MAVAHAAPDPDGRVIYADRGAIAGCRYGYALGLSACDADLILGATWVDIPDGSGFLPLSVSTESSQQDSGRVRLRWNVVGGDGLGVKVFHRDSCSDWTQIAETSADDSGSVSVEDGGPFFEGRREYYRLSVHACGQDRDLGEVLADIAPGVGVPTMANLVHQEVDSTTVLFVWEQLSGPPS